MRNMGLLHIQRELQFAFEESTARLAYCFGVLAITFDHDHKVIRIPTVGYSRFPLSVFSHSNGPLLENREVPCPPVLSHFLVQVVPFHPLIELMQHDVRKKWRDDPALWNARARSTEQIAINAACLDELPEQSE